MGNFTSAETSHLEEAIDAGNLALAGIIIAENPKIIVSRKSVESAINQRKQSCTQDLFARELVRKIRTGVLKVSKPAVVSELQDSGE